MQPCALSKLENPTRRTGIAMTDTKHDDMEHFRAVSVFRIGPMNITPEAVQALLDEHEHAAEKHGYGHVLTNPEMAEGEKFAALTEELGEVAQLLTYDKRPAQDAATPEIQARWNQEWRTKLAGELLQVSNLALAWRESVINGGT